MLDVSPMAHSTSVFADAKPRPLSASNSMVMFVIRHKLVVHAPISRCFALSTSVEVVHRELHMTPVGGRTSGLVQPGDYIRWEGMQLGFWNYHVSKIYCFEPPAYFRDRMIAGRFKSFEHDHRLVPSADGTILSDEIRFEMRFGLVGWVVGVLVLKPHITKLLHRRFRLIKQLAEGNGWRSYVPTE
jgi:ligand-binding SRPBCC domain-containing protein